MLKEQGGKQINSALMGEHHLCCVLVEAGSCVTKSTWLRTACILRHTKGAKSDYKINKACCSGIPYLRGGLSWQPECLNAELVCELCNTQVCASVCTDRLCSCICGLGSPGFHCKCLCFGLDCLRLTWRSLAFCAVLAGFFLCYE